MKQILGIRSNIVQYLNIEDAKPAAELIIVLVGVEYEMNNIEEVVATRKTETVRISCTAPAIDMLIDNLQAIKKQLEEIEKK